MFPLVGLPSSIISRLKGYRRVFCREAGFKHIARYISGLLLSPNKTLQGIYSHFVFPDGENVSRRAMHESIFESGWSVSELMSQHRQEVSSVHHGRGREVISLDWTLSHHDSSEHIYGAKRAYDYVNQRMSTYQTVMTAAIANPERIDGLWTELQFPNYQQRRANVFADDLPAKLRGAGPSEPTTIGVIALSKESPILSKTHRNCGVDG